MLRMQPIARMPKITEVYLEYSSMVNVGHVVDGEARFKIFVLSCPIY